MRLKDYLNAAVLLAGAFFGSQASAEEAQKPEAPGKQETSKIALIEWNSQKRPGCNYDLWLMDADGRNPKKLRESDYMASARFSPKDPYIAFYSAATSEKGAQLRCEVIRYDGKGVKNFDALGNGLDWSHDGQLLAFCSYPPGIAVYNFKNSQTWTIDVSPEGSVRYHSPAFSPTCEKIAFGRFKEDKATGKTAFEICIADITGDNQECLAAIKNLNSGDVPTIGWFEKNYVAFRGPSGRICLMDAKERRSIEKDAGADEIRVSPDGKKIMSFGQKVLIYDLNSLNDPMCEPRRIFPGFEPKVIAWHPDSDHAAAFGYDGKISVWNGDAWVPVYVRDRGAAYEIMQGVPKSIDISYGTIPQKKKQ